MGKPKPYRPLESEIQGACLEWLRLWGAFPVRINSGGMPGAGGGGVKFNKEEGCSDCLCVLPGGRFAAIEFNRPGEKPTEKQREFLDRVIHCGGLALIATSLDDLREQLQRAEYTV
jgi:putative hemolysin